VLQVRTVKEGQRPKRKRHRHDPHAKHNTRSIEQMNLTGKAAALASQSSLPGG
jgi:hypothetical protein